MTSCMLLLEHFKISSLVLEHDLLGKGFIQPQIDSDGPSHLANLGINKLLTKFSEQSVLFLGTDEFFLG